MEIFKINFKISKARNRAYKEAWNLLFAGLLLENNMTVLDTMGVMTHALLSIFVSLCNNNFSPKIVYFVSI